MGAVELAHADIDYPKKTEEEVLPEKAKLLSIRFPQDLEYTARVIATGGIAVIAFNGIYGIFGNADDPNIADKIIEIKNRPTDKKLILTTPPEYLKEHVDFKRTYYTHDQIVKLQKDVHALGVILPASTSAPQHLVNNGTILSIWTEYEPLKPIRCLVDHLRKHNIRALIGTSANKSGEPTHNKGWAVWDEFKHDVGAIVLDSFSHLDETRMKSTTIVDLTSEVPILKRAGNVLAVEISDVLKNCGMPNLVIEHNYVKVKMRE